MYCETEIERILNFWFGESSEVSLDVQRCWWRKAPTFDAKIFELFASVHDHAVQGKCARWVECAKGRLALIILFDQFSRHLYRNTAQAYAHDEVALDLCLKGLDYGHDMRLKVFKRAFYYMPLMHAENLEYQEEALTRLRELLDEVPSMQKDKISGFVRSALRHCLVIEKFGRFPHRNVLLGRKNSAREEEFLKQPGSSF